MGANKKPVPSLRKPPAPQPLDSLDQWVSGAPEPKASHPVVHEHTAPRTTTVAVAAHKEPPHGHHDAELPREEPVAHADAPSTVLDPEPLSVQTPERSSTRAAERPSAPKGRSAGGRKLLKRADGRELTRLQVYLEPALAKKLKRHCVDQDVDMTSFVRQLIEKALSRAG